MTRAVSTKTGWDIHLLNLADKKTTVLLQTPFAEGNPVLTRDGKWMVYQTDESGRYEVYVRRLDGEGGKWQISTDGGTRPRWSRGEKEIVFQTPDYGLMTVDVELGPAFSASVPRPFMNPGLRQIQGYQYDVSGDGTLVLVNRAVVQESRPRDARPELDGGASAMSLSPGSRLGTYEITGPARRGRDGSRLPRHRPEAEARGRDQGPARRRSPRTSTDSPVSSARRRSWPSCSTPTSPRSTASRSRAASAPSSWSSSRAKTSPSA